MPRRKRSKSRNRRRVDEDASFGRNAAPECSSQDYWQSVKISQSIPHHTKRESGTPSPQQPSLPSNSILDISVVVIFVGVGIFRCSGVDELPNFKTNLERNLLDEAKLYANSTFYIFGDPPMLSQIISRVQKNHNQSEHSLIHRMRQVSILLGYLRIAVMYFLIRKFASTFHIGFVAAMIFLSYDFYGRSTADDALYPLSTSSENCMLLIAVLCYTHIEPRIVNIAQVAWTFAACLCLSFAFCLKYSAASSIFIAFLLSSLRNIWRLLDDCKISMRKITTIFLLKIVIFMWIPVGVYGSLCYFHISSLVNSGPDARFLSSKYQSTLRSNFSNVTANQPTAILPGSRITLRNTNSKIPCWLHSEDTVYPMIYEDKRGSSHQQVVTCFQQKDSANWWFVTSYDITEEEEPIRNGDEIQLIHGVTRRLLNSHDVAAPVSPRSQEVSCYVDYNVSMPVEPNWKLVLVNPEESNDEWNPITSKLRLIHTGTGSSLRMTGRQLPDWLPGAHLEVAADSEGGFHIWNVEEHKNEEAGNEPNDSSLKKPTETMSFWAKFWELHMFAKEEHLDYRTFDFYFLDFLWSGVPTEVLITNASETGTYQSLFIGEYGMLDPLIRLGTILSLIFCGIGICMQHRYGSLTKEFDGILNAWQVVGFPMFCISIPYFYYERLIYAEEFHILLHMGFIVTVLFLECVSIKVYKQLSTK